MYSTCLFCSGDLGRNEALEHFPVGRRLAYDAARGRLWVVCRRCARWNLTPAEQRWEAIEEAERLYRGTRLRAATDNVGLARVADRTELVRIGEPLRPEFAAWRYGDQFGRRRRRNLLVSGGVIAGGALIVGGAASAGLGLLMTWQLGRFLYGHAVHGRSSETVARLRSPGGTRLDVRRGQLARCRIMAGDGGAPVFVVPHETRTIHFGGDDARRAAAALLPAVNRFAGTAAEVRHAVTRLDDAGGPEAFFQTLGRRAGRLTRISTTRDRDQFGNEAAARSGLLALPPSLALAIEMASHEEQERRALEGELAELERSWREAEEIAEIADDLLLPGRVHRRLAGLRDARGAGVDSPDPKPADRA